MAHASVKPQRSFTKLIFTANLFRLLFSSYLNRLLCLTLQGSWLRVWSILECLGRQIELRNAFKKKVK